MVAVLAASVVVSFILQVAFYRPDALVSRLSIALTGSVLLTAIAAVVFQVLSVVD
jgi:predicted membrane-bound mannosyltransferase